MLKSIYTFLTLNSSLLTFKALLQVSEAGGHLVNGKDGSEFDYMDRYILATNSKALSDQIVQLGLKTVTKEKDFPEHCPMWKKNQLQYLAF